MAEPQPPPAPAPGPEVPPIVVRRVGGLNLDGLEFVAEAEADLYAIMEAEEVVAPPPLGGARQAIPTRPSDGNPSTMRAGGKYGDASVAPVNTFDFSMRYSLARQDFLSPILETVRGLHRKVGIMANELVIGNTMMLERLGAAAPSARITTRIPLRHAALPAMGNFRIKFTGRRKIGSLDLSKLDCYTTNNSIDARIVASSLRGDRLVGKAISEKLSASFRQSTELYDNVGMFAAAYLIAYHLTILQLNGTVVNPGVIPAGVILTANLATEDAQAAEVITTVNKALAGKYVCLDGGLMSEADWFLVQALAAGLPYFNGPEADANHTIFRHITSSSQYFLIYDDKPIEQPAAGVPTAAAVIASIHRLSELTQDQNGMLRGYLRASTIAFGKLRTEGAAGAEERRFFTAGLETGQTRLPTPGGYNLLWQLLKIGPTPIPSGQLSRDLLALSSMDIGEHLRVGVISAALFGLGVSAALHSINISGRELNAWASATPCVSTNILNDLFRKDESMDTIPLYLAAVGFSQQATKCILSADAFHTNNFCGSWVGMAALNDNTGWRGAFGLHIPYIFEPMSLQWIIQKWPSIYGYSGIGPEVNLGPELIMSENADGNQFNFWQGDSKYLEIAAGPRPYIYIPYAGFLANIICQDQRLAQMPAFAYTPIYKSGGSRAALGPILIDDAAIRPPFYPDISTIKVGMITYDYARGCVLGPVWPRDRIDDRVWEFLTRTTNWKASFAGFLGGPRPERIVTPYAIGMASDLVVGGSSGAVRRPEAAEEEGN